MISARIAFSTALRVSCLALVAAFASACAVVKLAMQSISDVYPPSLPLISAAESLRAVMLVAATVLKFCNWLSDKAGLKQVYSFGTDKPDNRKIENFAGISIDVFANGYRIPTLDEFRFASIHGDYESFWTKIATKEMMRRFNPKTKGPNPTFATYPNAWGFLGLRGNLWEMVVDNEYQISVSVSGEGIQLWNVAVPFPEISDSKKSTNGFRLVQGAIENPKIKPNKK